MSTLITTTAQIGTIKDAGGNATAMTLDSAGRVAQPNKPAFAIRLQSTSSTDFTSGITLAGSTYYQSSTLEEQGGSNFNVSQGRFTAPVTGFYFFSVGIRFDAFAGSYLYMTLEGSKMIGRHLSSVQSTYLNPTIASACQLDAGEYIHVAVVSNGDSGVSINSDSYFSGFMIG
jgi:hypothetical protein|tara:strand:+ start:677 stop:1195 length:519 start_codon:yes stop_codon:yes gene_type:complete